MESALVHELAFDIEQSRLAVVDEHEPRRPDPRDLAAELRSDRAARSGDEDDLAGEVVGDRRDVDLHRLAPEQVLHLDGADLPGQVEIGRDHLRETRQRLHGNARGPRDLDDTLARLARCRGNRDQELVRATIVKQVLELRRRAQDADAVQPQVLLPRVVVDEPDGRVPERRGAQHLAQDLLGRVSGSHDDDLFAPGDDRPGGRALDQRAREEPAARHEGEQQQEIDDPDPPRNPSRMKGREREDEEHDDDGDADSSEGAPHVPRRDVPPPPVVEPECDEDRNRDGDDEEDDVPVEVPPVVDRRLMVEAHVPGEHPGRSDDGHVDDQLPETVAIDEASHARTPSVACTVSTTRSCCSSVIPAQSGTEKFSRAARSVSGRSPSL